MDITKLYHCTSFGSLESILRSGEFWPSYCLEKADYLNKTYEFSFAMVCFADLIYLDPIQFKDKSIRKQKHDQLIKRNYTLKFGWNDIETIGVTNWSNKIEIVHLLTQNHSIRFTDAWNKIKVMQKWHF